MSNTKRRIFIVNQTDDSHKFGVGKYISQMILETQKRLLEFEMVVVNIGALGTWKPSIQNDGNITYLDIPRTFIHDATIFQIMTRQYSRAVFCLLSDFFNFSSNDIFHFNNHMHHILIKEIAGNTDARIIYTIHISLWKIFFDNDRYKFQSHWKKGDGKNSKIKAIEGESKNCSIADSVICISKEMADDVVQFYGVPPAKLKIVPNGLCQNIDNISPEKVNTLRNNLGISEKTFVFFYAGRLTEQKGVKTILGAFSNLLMKKNAIVSIALLVAGDGPLRKTLENKARKKENQIIFTGYIPPTKMSQYYRLADTVVFPSNNEQAGYVVLEAMKHKLPIILSNIKTFQYLKNGEHCLKVRRIKNKEHNLWANAMHMTLIDGTLRNSIAENAHKLFLKKYNSSVMFDLTYQ